MFETITIKQTKKTRDGINLYGTLRIKFEKKKKIRFILTNISRWKKYLEK